MTYTEKLRTAQKNLRHALDLLNDEMRSYPTPVSGCDAQYNYLVGLRASVFEALHVLEEPRFVATPRTPDRMAGVESR